MKMSALRISALWVLLALFCACGSRKESASAADSASHEADFTDEAMAWVDSVYAAMSPEERAAQLLLPAVYANSDAVSAGSIKHYAEELRTGGLLLLKGDAGSAALIADSLEAVRDRNPNSPGFFLAMDAETGLGMRFSDAPLFPWNSNIDQSVDDQTFFDYGREVGREARIAGINMILGPVVDINRPDMRVSGIMRRRSLGSDQQRVALLSVAYALGIESQGVASVPKHFPGHGATSSDSHNTLPEIRIDRQELFDVDILPFVSAIENGVSAIMVGHLWAPALDSVRRPASFSPVVIDSILRRDLRFKGLVLVDAVNMGGARGFSGADAIIAGSDLIIAPADTGKELSNILEALASGRLPESRLEESCKRILLQKYIQQIPFYHRGDDSSGEGNIKERLHKEAPGIINRLKGNPLLSQ